MVIKTGTAGNNTLIGTAAVDTLSGLGGNDTLRGLASNDRLYGGWGSDYAEGGAGNDLVRGDDGDDKLFGNDGNDQLFGLNGNDRLWGGDYKDLLDGGAGSNLLYGGNGDDEIYLRGDGISRDQGWGNAGNDLFRIEGSNIVATGEAGADRFELIYEGSANLTGGPGSDRYTIEANQGLVQSFTITDYQSGSDVLDLHTNDETGRHDLASHIARFDVSKDGKLSRADGPSQSMGDGDGYRFEGEALTLQLDDLSLVLANVDTLF